MEQYMADVKAGMDVPGERIQIDLQVNTDEPAYKRGYLDATRDCLKAITGHINQKYPPMKAKPPIPEVGMNDGLGWQR